MLDKKKKYRIIKQRLEDIIMDKGFIDLTKKMVKDRGIDILNDARITKALLMDYSHGEYKKEINLLIKIIELGFPKRVKEADNIKIIKIILSRELTEDLFIMENMSSSIVSLLISLIRNIRYDDINEIKSSKHSSNGLKRKAIKLCREKGFNLNGNVTFASKNGTASTYWANPNIQFLTYDWWLLLNDYEHHNLHIFYIPANSIKDYQIKVRADRSYKIDLQIIYENDLFEDSRSGIQFIKWFKKTICFLL
jgi:hypothetical protein